ncbi:GIY-YIG nuclease family protein [Microbacterium aurum]|uniref:GIY-YIG nuclease family protein n=2 Tax=Microbacterium TaxID=33882 RepID=UPI00199B1BCD|nr:GIY-YIG nuclease family protein [Microbacterium aurum]MBD3757779.1 GIY-YIG nuclease family protein [Microbacterium sp.]MCG7413386.1 GIY-YIG nuclease family protein [Microbacterium aurum]
MPYMYIRECSDGSYDVGSCRNLDQRLWLHDLGEGAEYTKRRRSLKLVSCEEFPNVGDAFAREKQVQGWGRAKKAFGGDVSRETLWFRYAARSSRLLNHRWAARSARLLGHRGRG